MARAERVLFVHAHPDDETIDTGGTIAALVDRGAAVTVLTCTRGERGEVIPADLAPALESHAELANLRTGELTAAMKILGVIDHRYLGDDSASWSGSGNRRYVDSGMRWGKRGAEPSEESDAASLTAADLADVSSDIASVLIAVDPDAVVSYDAHGGYGHPDHRRVHDAARRAAGIYGIPFFAVRPEPRQPAGARGRAETVAREPSISIDVTAVFDRKRAALAAYRSQLELDGDDIVFSGGQRQAIGSIERFDFVDPPSADAPDFGDQPTGARFAVLTLSAVLGVGVGALLSVYNQVTAPILGQSVWVGAIGAILVAVALLTGLRLAFGSRLVSAIAAVGMIVMVGAMSTLGAGGAVVIPWNGPGITWQIAPTVIAVVVLVWPRVRRARPGKIAGRSIVIAS